MTERTEYEGIPLAELLGSTVRDLEPGPDLDQTVERIVKAAVATVPGTEFAGISLLAGGQMRSIAPTNDLVARLDNLQHELGEGPCVDAAFDRPIYRVAEIATDGRWPRFAAAAAGEGIGSMLGVRLFTTSTNLGALNLYSSRHDAFDEDAEHLADLFAAHAAVALAGSRRQEQLARALRTRDTISTAKGILMERHKINDDQAFHLLVQASQTTNRKLHEVAAWLVRDLSGG